MISNKIIENTPIDSSQNTLLAQLGQCSEIGSRKRRRYTRAQKIEQLAIRKYKNNGRGITFNDLISCGLTLHKEQAQITLKHCLENNVLFTLTNHKPQQYYPASLRAEILNQKMSKNTPIGVTEVDYYYSKRLLLSNNANSENNNFCSDSIAMQSLEGYVLPLLPSTPLYIHKMQFKLKIRSESYNELALPADAWNKGKEHEEIIGSTHVRYHFYANGTVMIFTESSNNPFKVEDETDLCRLIALFGQVRDRLVTFLADKHERIVPGILEWELTQCDINKDIKVGDALQYTGLKVQVKHFDRLFRVYIKSLGKETACRVEQSLNPKKPAIQTINEIFLRPNNPDIQSQQSYSDDRRKITEIHDMIKCLLNIHNYNSAIVQEQGKGGEGS